jgi:hypothetical protein
VAGASVRVAQARGSDRDLAFGRDTSRGLDHEADRTAPSGAGFDEPAPQQRMAEPIASTRFITGKSMMSAHETPRYTG